VASELKRLQEQAARDFDELQAKISAPEAEDKKSVGDKLRDLGREAVQNDVMELRKKLEQRKKLAELDEDVEKAKGDVVKCLRSNDRRPLDCWREVQRFRDEVRRLEEVWVDKVVR
jgi:altered-inheritance-of-mitochondria protein 13